MLYTLLLIDCQFCNAYPVLLEPGPGLGGLPRPGLAQRAAPAGQALHHTGQAGGRQVVGLAHPRRVRVQPGCGQQSHHLQGEAVLDLIVNKDVGQFSTSVGPRPGERGRQAMLASPGPGLVASLSLAWTNPSSRLMS